MTRYFPSEFFIVKSCDGVWDASTIIEATALWLLIMLHNFEK